MVSLRRKKMDIYSEFPTLNKIPKENFPYFIFIIPDGNRRYAKERGKSVLWGHKKGLDLSIQLLRSIRPLPVKVVGFWGFSSDNWKRNEREIKGLMSLFELFLTKYVGELIENNSRFIHLGRKDRLPKRLVDKIKEVENKTSKNTGQIVCAALDFGGEDQMIRILNKARQLDKNIEINPELLHSLKDGNGVIPSADLIIRTSEIRTSDLGWINGKNTVLYFIPEKYFPDMDNGDVVKGIEFFYQTERRQGK
ncbi:MAG: di-trans,poly-cis-decaprenylcistransferase [Candidatus Levybacteria bacterium]|nr:di-trans,poly-cis-decaprenylcistransferase [Candidatus Levybacteria bacterium]